MTGQVAADPEHRVAGMTVSLMADGQVTAQTTTNAAGEFQVEYVPRPELQLRIDVRPDEPIELPLIHDGDESATGGRR